ncbi:protein kinase [Actinomadura fulvescens]|uniref:Protein kinase domain-containing protein n=1 Tax=Actinomadura fulvescens TaxID=46160 RepID=A0ABN3P8F8_9ACTN
MSEEHIGAYRVLTRLGAGDVHRAAGPTGRDVAIRLLPDEARDRLRADLDRMRAVRSPYVVDVLDGDPEAVRPYVVSRFVPGRSLDRFVAEQGPLAGAALHRLALDLAKALAAIHESGLAHRALRPQDVLVVDGSPVIIDFALAAPAEPAADIQAWAAVVSHAAGGAVPATLQPLLEAAAAPAETARPTAKTLVEAVTQLEPPPAPIPAAAAPSVVAAASRAVPLPVPAGVAPSTSASATASISGVATGGAGARRSGNGSGPVGTAVVQAWARLLAAMVVVAAAGFAVMLPVVGAVVSVVAVVLLRGAAGRGWAMAVGTTVVTVPYAGVFALVVTLGLASGSAVGVEVDPLAACAVGVGAGVAALWAAPGISGPRRGLQRLVAGVAGTPRAIAVGGVLLGVVAFLAVVGAISMTPSFGPMYGLQSSLESAVSQLQTRLQ